MTSILVLKDNFESVKSLRTSIIDLTYSLNIKVETLKSIYSELLDNNKSSNSLLDTLYFQTKLITFELKSINDMFNLIDNRIYGDYYKLYKSIVKFSNNKYTDNTILKLATNNFPIYNDLNCNTEYDFTVTQEIYGTIISLLDLMECDLVNRNNNLLKDETKKQQGIDIDNLLHNVKFNNTIINENIELFKHYIEAYNKFHKKYFSTFFIKVKLFYSQIDRDINIRKTPNIKDSNNKNYIKDYDINNIRDLVSDTSESSSVTEELNNIFSSINIDNDTNNNDISNIQLICDNVYNDSKQITCYLNYNYCFNK